MSLVCPSYFYTHSTLASQFLPTCLARTDLWSKAVSKLLSTKDLCQEIAFQQICQGNLSIPRDKMPQVSAPVLAQFLQDKEKQGIAIEKRRIAAHQLTPVQNELNGDKVGDMVDIWTKGGSNPCEKAILISSKNDDGKTYVIDGHHRYAACYITGGDQEVIDIIDPIHKVLSELENLPGIKKVTLTDIQVKS